jgi:hypothetical protein
MRPECVAQGGKVDWPISSCGQVVNFKGLKGEMFRLSYETLPANICKTRAVNLANRLFLVGKA